jgi:hypothetical protein
MTVTKTRYTGGRKSYDDRGEASFPRQSLLKQNYGLYIAASRRRVRGWARPRWIRPPKALLGPATVEGRDSSQGELAPRRGLRYVRYCYQTRRPLVMGPGVEVERYPLDRIGREPIWRCCAW